MTLCIPLSDRDHVRGRRDAPVVLVEYGDFECPHCAGARFIVDVLLEEMRDRLAYVYRHFPLTDLHPFAEFAAEAAEAAGTQGRFWEMHDVMFANQDALQADDLVAYAEALGLDVTRFIDELSARVHQPRVRDDVAGGLASGVSGTPTFFINGEGYDGARDVQSMLEALDRTAYSAR